MEQVITAPADKEKSAKSLATAVYALYAASFLIGITALIALIINYVKKGDVAGTIAESHFRWQIRTFWFGLLWMFIGAITIVLVVGWVIVIANSIWILYRLIKGWLRLNENKAMYA